MELRKSYLVMECYHLRKYDAFFDPSKMTDKQYHSTLMSMDIPQLEVLLEQLKAEEELFSFNRMRYRYDCFE